MFRANTRGIVAAVKNPEAIMDVAICKDPRRLMPTNLSLVACGLENPVAVVIKLSRPNLALAQIRPMRRCGTVLIDLGPEARNCGIVEFNHCWSLPWATLIEVVSVAALAASFHDIVFLTARRQILARMGNLKDARGQERSSGKAGKFCYPNPKEHPIYGKRIYRRTDGQPGKTRNEERRSGTLSRQDGIERLCRRTRREHGFTCQTRRAHRECGQCADQGLSRQRGRDEGRQARGEH